jgi:hypothetical protein
MKTPLSQDDPPRFQGPLRHYHRSGAKPHKSWDEWVEGKPADLHLPKSKKKVIVWGVALIALGGLIVGLVVNLS